MKLSRKAKIIVAASVLLVLAAFGLAGAELKRFRDASIQHQINTGFAEYIGFRFKRFGERSGKMTLPMKPQAWNGSPMGRVFAEGLGTELPPGEYHYFVYSAAMGMQFVVIDRKPKVVASGAIPKDLMIIEGAD